MNNGIEEVEINGVLRGFRGSPRAIALAEREDGCRAGELFQKMKEGDQLATLNIFYGAAVDYCNVKRKKVDFISSDVADWVFEIGVEKSMEILNSILDTYKEKKRQSMKMEEIPTSGNGQ